MGKYAIADAAKRLKHGVDIQRVLHGGNCWNGKAIRIAWIQNNLPYNRYAVAISKRWGNAVTRNKAKRLMREANRRDPGSTCTQDIVYIARVKDNMSYANVLQDILTWRIHSERSLPALYPRSEQ